MPRKKLHACFSEMLERNQLPRAIPSFSKHLQQHSVLYSPTDVHNALIQMLRVQSEGFDHDGLAHGIARVVTEHVIRRSGVSVPYAKLIRRFFSAAAKFHLMGKSNDGVQLGFSKSYQDKQKKHNTTLRNVVIADEFPAFLKSGLDVIEDWKKCARSLHEDSLAAPEPLSELEKRHAGIAVNVRASNLIDKGIGVFSTYLKNAQLSKEFF